MKHEFAALRSRGKGDRSRLGCGPPLVLVETVQQGFLRTLRELGCSKVAVLA